MKKLTALFLALALCLSLSVPALAAGTSFSDVPAGHWAYSAIHTAAEKGAISGYADGTFRPTRPLTNAQFAVMLARAFFLKESESLKLQIESKPWYWANMQALHNHHILAGTALDASPKWNAAASRDASRYDVAQMIYNILTDQGKAATPEQRAAAQAKIPDWGSVHSNYRTAVSTCYALGLLNGREDGGFHGATAMNRAQGCVVLNRLADCLSVQAPWPEEENPKSTTVAVSSVRTPTETGSTTGWTISDNAYPDGILNNGKLLTQENVRAMLEEAKAIWHDGMPWGGIVKGDNNYYDAYAFDGLLTHGGELIINQGGTPTTNAGGFAAMVSDYVFGLRSNQGKKLEDNTKVRPGDIIFQLANGKLEHTRVALSTVHYQDGVPFSATCDGNINAAISWDDDGEERSCRLDGYNRDDGAYITCVVYTRYPE